MTGGVLLWKSKKQPITAHSTVETELIALPYTVPGGPWLEQLMCDTGIRMPKA